MVSTYHVLKTDWQTKVSLTTIKKRAELYQKIRDFFAQRNVLEVETPLLAEYTIPDPNILSIPASYQADNTIQARQCFLQTSPEFAMKRLLASGMGCIFQICKAFRNDHYGRMHNPEFTMLEWYRVDFDHHQLMQEVDELFQSILSCKPAQKMSYQKLFLQQLEIDPLQANCLQLLACAVEQGITLSKKLTALQDKDTYLNLLMSHCIEPKLGLQQPVIVYDYPASQAALAKLDKNDPRVAQRFEVFYQGVELANGFCELNNSAEQRTRFQDYQNESKQLGLPAHELDEIFLMSLDYLPDCAGVALGLDRLLMLLLNLKQIDQVIVFAAL